jgi:hypothetical protein
MIFRRKQDPVTPGGPAVPRGRDDSGPSAGKGPSGGENPLARRFQGDAEPATVDLADPARFHAAPKPEESPQTTNLQKHPESLGRVISRDAATGKLYVHPGGDDCPVLLQNEAVLAPTELRRGDTIRVGDAAFTLLDAS